MDPATDRIARRFPLAARTRPPCPPLAERVAGLAAAARAAQDGNDALEATAVLNLAALLASDLDLPELARTWCHRHADAYLRSPELGPDGAQRALEPLVNLARLEIRAGRGRQAAALIAQLYTAVDRRSDTVLDGIAVPAATMTGGPDTHREIRRWLWSVMLATTARALAAAGCWAQALTALHEAKGIGNRMLDGRQIAVLARLDAGDPDGALALALATEPGEAWQHPVTLALAALAARCSRRPPAARELLDAYRDLPPAPGLAVFRTRLGLAVLDTLGGPHAPACRSTARALIEEVVAGGDGYAARDLLTGDGYRDLLTGPESRLLADRVQDCGLGRALLAPPYDTELAQAVDRAVRVITLHTGATREVGRV